MDVRGSLTIEPGAPAILSRMEDQIQDAEGKAMKQALNRVVRQSEKQQKTGPACGSEHLDLCGTRQQVLLTRVGRVELPLIRICDLLCRR